MSPVTCHGGSGRAPKWCGRSQRKYWHWNFFFKLTAKFGNIPLACTNYNENLINSGSLLTVSFRRKLMRFPPLRNSNSDPCQNEIRFVSPDSMIRWWCQYVKLVKVFQASMTLKSWLIERRLTQLWSVIIKIGPTIICFNRIQFSFSFYFDRSARMIKRSIYVCDEFWSWPWCWHDMTGPH